jgi:hypothetical protein
MLPRPTILKSEASQSSGSEMPLNFQGEYIKAVLNNFLKTI